MKKTTWYKHHKWLGILLSFFLLMFCLSGLVLNHPALFSDINISRSYLPESYQYSQWNRGLLRGTVKWHDKVLLYGNAGIWQTDSTARSFNDFNQGLPSGADFRNVRGMAFMPSGRVFAAGQYGLYELIGNRWESINLPIGNHEKLSDITIRGDSLLITGRSFVYLSTPPYRQFQRIMLRPASNNDGKVSLFRTVWLLHSGELFGIFGVLFVDFIALILIFLVLTGIIYWVHPKWGKKIHMYQKAGSWHNHIGRISIVFTVFLCVTGWLLRPPVSVMGINVETQDENGYWLIGSFSGMYIWDRTTDIIADYFTHGPAQAPKGIPVSDHAIAGYSNDFGKYEYVVDYNTGCKSIKMPVTMQKLPMSLRNLSLEIHTGRIYTFLGIGNVLYIFIIGLAILWCLWSGWKIRCQRREKKKETA